MSYNLLPKRLNNVMMNLNASSHFLSLFCSSTFSSSGSFYSSNSMCQYSRLCASSPPPSKMKHSSGSSSFIPILSVLFLVLVTTEVAVEARKSSPGEKTNVENLQKPKCSGDEDCFGEAVFNSSLKTKKGNSKMENMKAILTFRDFTKRGGEKATCGDKYYRNTKKVVAISSDWLGDDSERCNKQISITGNGVTVTAEVVDECDISDDCIAASRRVWKGLGIRRRKARKESIEVTWSDA